MANFPTLNTGAVAQYPLLLGSRQASGVIRFLDGAGQRYRLQARSLRRWQIRLDLLNEDELEALEAFFESQLGGYTPFVFPDPLSGVGIPNCRLGGDTMTLESDGVDRGGATVWVIESNG